MINSLYGIAIILSPDELLLSLSRQNLARQAVFCRTWKNKARPTSAPA
jgi:hypothetical protein